MQLARGLEPRQPQSIPRLCSCFFAKQEALMASDSHEISDDSRTTVDLLSVLRQEVVPLQVAQCELHHLSAPEQ